MLVIHDFQPRLMSYLKLIDNKTVFVFAVDQWVFERDVDRGLLGESIASKLIFPYTAIQGTNYLHDKEVELKQRLVTELLENLVINFPELALRIKILPQYFVYEVFSSRIRVFPLLNYDLADLTNCLTQNEQQEVDSYMIALKHLEAQQKITLQNSYVLITKKFINQCQDPKIRIINLSKNAPRTIFTALFGVLPQLMNIVTQNAETFLRTQKINWIRQPDQKYRPIDPQKYVFFPTAEGLVSLSDKIDIKGFAQRLLLKGQNVKIEVEPVGGVLNDVYLIKAGKTKVLAKRFKDWSGFKWFPLTLWSFGARSFAVSGQARLSKECAISEFLRSEGFNVPRILHVSNPERIVFMEFIESESLSESIKEYSTTGDERKAANILLTISRVGETLAKVHGYNVALGDTKPDNVLIKADATIYLIDFEQAQQGGDKAWDIAVFLYYCGHYLQPFDNTTKAEKITEAFIEGYLKGGGNIDNIRKAGLPKYTRVFSIFTLPSIMLAISNTCKKALGNSKQ
jgi:tRNA A-37 threonylcarbamoyl transferase component Bud32